jgi:hypothetical protein
MTHHRDSIGSCETGQFASEFGTVNEPMFSSAVLCLFPAEVKGQVGQIPNNVKEAIGYFFRPSGFGTGHSIMQAYQDWRPKPIEKSGEPVAVGSRYVEQTGLEVNVDNLGMVSLSCGSVPGFQPRINRVLSSVPGPRK